MGAAMPEAQNLGAVRHYYSVLRDTGKNLLSVYGIWERGGAYNDSVTPSTYCSQYRAHITETIKSLIPTGKVVFSVGCGNGFVEGDLVKDGFAVRAIDCNSEAVELSRKKGVDAREVDFFALEPNSLGDVDLVYADGFIGHLFRMDSGLARVFEKLQSLKLRSGTWVVLSNDAPRDPLALFAPHEKLADFWFISRSYLESQLQRAGFSNTKSHYFSYERPLSGLRDRTICLAQIP